MVRRHRLGQRHDLGQCIHDADAGVCDRRWRATRFTWRTIMPKAPAATITLTSSGTIEQPDQDHLRQSRRFGAAGFSRPARDGSGHHHRPTAPALTWLAPRITTASFLRPAWRANTCNIACTTAAHRWIGCGLTIVRCASARPVQRLVSAQLAVGSSVGHYVEFNNTTVSFANARQSIAISRNVCVAQHAIGVARRTISDYSVYLRRRGAAARLNASASICQRAGSGKTIVGGTVGERYTARVSSLLIAS